MDYISNLPLSEGPEIFGLHENANISCALAETSLLLDTALSLQPRSLGVGGGAGAAGQSWDQTLTELSQSISKNIPQPFDLEKALLDFPVQYTESMNTVLTQELLRFNRLIERLTTTLHDIQRALKGRVSV